MSLMTSRLDFSAVSIFAVDDNDQALGLLEEILRGFRAGNTTVCASALAAQDLLAATRFDLLIIDADMPEEDGITLTQRIRSRPDQPNFTSPVVLASSHTPLERIRRARDAGVNVFIKKPIIPAVLLERLSWLARNTRPFVSAPAYCGPDRRFRKGPPPDGFEDRRAEGIALAATPDRALSQNDIDALFN
ncbi:MAG: response regulator [Caulobacter sp.]